MLQLQDTIKESFQAKSVQEKYINESNFSLTIRTKQNGWHWTEVALCHAKNDGKWPDFIGDNLEIIQITNYVGRAENISNGPIFQALAPPFSIKLWK